MLRFHVLAMLVASLAAGNLLTNGDFSAWDNSTQPTGWIVENESLARVGQCADTSRSPAYSVRITRLVAGTGNNNGLRQNLTVTPGQPYTLSAWYLDNDVNARAGLSITWRTAGDSFIENSGTVYTDSAIRTWQQLSKTDTAPANAAVANVLLRIYGFTGSPAGGVAYLDDADFSLGTGAVAEAPANFSRARLAATPTLVVRHTSIRYAQPLAGPLSLTVHDLTGTARRCLVSSRLTAGEHVVTWDGTDDSGRRLPDGLYFAVLRTTSGETVRKLVLDR